MTHTLPRDAFDILEEVFKSKDKAEKFAKAIEDIIGFSKEKAKEVIEDKKEHIKIELKDELKNELVTRELFDERFKGIDERFKGIDERFKSIDERFKTLDFKLNILIFLMLIIISFANPTFLEFVKMILK